MKVKNATTMPKTYFGLHMVPGVAEYKDPNAAEGFYRIYVDEEAIKKMNPSYAGKPVYVDHVDKVNLSNLQEEADGYVFESFYNPADGKTWAKFVVVSDKGHEAIAKGYRLSNCYEIKEHGGGGLWNGIEYDRQVFLGEYEHLAIVEKPRYQESIILTAEQFKEYNLKKEQELKKLQNSVEDKKKGESSMFKLFKREKVENAQDYENMIVELPKSKKEVKLASIINMADEHEMKKENQEPEYAVEHMLVKTNEGDMSVKELVNKYHNMCSAKKNEEAEGEKLKENEEGVHVDIDSHKGEEKKENEDEKKESPIEEKKEHNEEEKKEEGEKQHNSANFEKLANAHKNPARADTVLYTSADKVQVGKQKYGSN